MVEDLTLEDRIKIIKEYLDNQDYASALIQSRAVTLLYPSKAIGYLLCVQSSTNNFASPLKEELKQEQLGKLYTDLSTGEISPKEEEIISLLKIANQHIKTEEEKELAGKARKYINVIHGYNNLKNKVISSYEMIKSLQKEGEKNSEQKKNDKKVKSTLYIPSLIISITLFLVIATFSVLAIVKHNFSFMIPVFIAIIPFIVLLLVTIYLMLLNKNTKIMYMEREESIIKRIASIKNDLINYYISNGIDERIVEQIINSKE